MTKTLRKKTAATTPQTGLSWRFWLGIGLGIAGLVGIFFVMQLGANTNTAAAAPDFTAPTMDGQRVRLEDYRGQVVMLNFWATWCPPCRAEMPILQAAYERYQAQGFTILAINNAESLAEVQPFAAALGLEFPVVMDESKSLQRLFKIDAYPTSIFLAPDGTVIATHQGAVNMTQLTGYIEKGLQS